MQTNVLLIATDPQVAEPISKWLEDFDCALDTATCLDSAIQALAAREHDIVFCANDLEAAPGRPLLLQLAGRSKDSVVISLGCPEGVAATTRLIRNGITECLRLPLEAGDFLLTMKRSAERLEQGVREESLKEQREDDSLKRPLVAATSPTIQLMQKIEECAALDTPVLVLGEYGVGKESVARAIHAHSARRHDLFVRVTPQQLNGSELDFLLQGNPKGSKRSDARRGWRLIERAQGGTLFFDGLEQLSPLVAGNLAQQLGVHARSAGPGGTRTALGMRLVASAEQEDATTLNENARILRAVFAETVVQVPALRERQEDIPLLVDHLVTLARGEESRRHSALNGKLLKRFSEHPWPGNLRELENVIERAMLMATSRNRPLEEAFATCLTPAVSAASADSPKELELRPARKRFERELILRALHDCDGNRTHAARKLKISHRALLYKLKSHEITDD